MALTRKMLSAMEIDAEKINQIIDGHTETVTALQDEIDKAKAEANQYKAEADKVAGLEKELEAAKKEAETAKKSGADYEALKKEYEDYKADTEKKAVRASKESAYKEILKDAGVPEKHWAKILKYSDVDGIELDDKGKATTAKDILKSVKEEWADHIETTTTTGAKVDNPPANTGKKMTVAEIDAIEDTAERQRMMAEHHDLYGI